MLALFKGELTYHEFMREMSYNEMMALRDARVKQLVDEQKSIEKETKNTNDLRDLQQKLNAIDKAFT